MDSKEKMKDSWIGKKSKNGRNETFFEGNKQEDIWGVLERHDSTTELYSYE